MKDLETPSDSKFPARHHPAHPQPLARNEIPTILFVTVSLRASNPYHYLDNDEVHQSLKLSWGKSPEWIVGIYMVMPDHLHFFCSPVEPQSLSIKRWCQKWKAGVTRDIKPDAWQWLSNCWDVQIRNEQGYEEKRQYALLNPVRKGLVKNSEDWPYQGKLYALWR